MLIQMWEYWALNQFFSYTSHIAAACQSQVHRMIWEKVCSIYKYSCGGINTEVKSKSSFHERPSIPKQETPPQTSMWRKDCNIHNNTYSCQRRHEGIKLIIYPFCTEPHLNILEHSQNYHPQLVQVKERCSIHKYMNTATSTEAQAIGFQYKCSWEAKPEALAEKEGL